MLNPINPTTGTALPEVESLTLAEAEDTIGQAVAAAPAWAAMSYSERAKCLINIAADMRKSKDELAQLMAKEMGKPLREGLGEVEKSAFCAEYYADNGEAFLERETLASDATDSYVCKQQL